MVVKCLRVLLYKIFYIKLEMMLRAKYVATVINKWLIQLFSFGLLNVSTKDDKISKERRQKW